MLQENLATLEANPIVEESTEITDQGKPDKYRLSAALIPALSPMEYVIYTQLMDEINTIISEGEETKTTTEELLVSVANADKTLTDIEAQKQAQGLTYQADLAQMEQEEKQAIKLAKKRNPNKTRHISLGDALPKGLYKEFSDFSYPITLNDWPNERLCRVLYTRLYELGFHFNMDDPTVIQEILKAGLDEISASTINPEDPNFYLHSVCGPILGTNLMHPRVVQLIQSLGTGLDIQGTQFIFTYKDGIPNSEQQTAIETINQAYKEKRLQLEERFRDETVAFEQKIQTQIIERRQKLEELRTFIKGLLLTSVKTDIEIKTQQEQEMSQRINNLVLLSVKIENELRVFGEKAE